MIRLSPGPLPLSLSVALAGVLAGCPSADPAPAEPMVVAGDYVLAGQQLDSECVGADWDFWEIFDFMERTPTDVPSMQLIVTQSGGSLSAAEAPAGCTLDGSVGATGAFSLRGPCDTASMDRDLEITGNITLFGATFDVDANMRIEVDQSDGAGGPPDGVVDCVVTTVELSGSGSASEE